MSTLLALAATTMGIGALYYGLPVARYRKKLHNAIEEALRSQSYSKDIHDKISKNLREDNSFARDYHSLAMWYSELPGSTREELKGTVADVFEGVSQTGELPAYYEWFKYNIDKATSLLLAVLVPLVGLWLLHYYPDFVEKHSHWCELWLVFAQVWVISHMLIGTIALNIEALSIKARLSTLITKVESPRAN